MATRAYLSAALLAAAVFLWAALPATARVEMSATTGFDGALKGEGWTPVAVTLSNTGPGAIEGDLFLRNLDDNAGGFPGCRASVSMPAGSKKRYHIYACFPQYGGGVEVVLARGNKVLAGQRVRVSPLDAKDLLVVTVGGRAGRLNYLAGETITGPKSPPAAGPSTSIHVGSLDEELLSDRPAAYSGADVIVTGAISTDAVDPRALQALAMWVASGGTLVVSTGPDYRRFQDPVYADLLPVTITGGADIPRPPNMTSFSAVRFPDGPVAISTSTPRAGAKLIGPALMGHPIVAHRSYGLGQVVYVALDVSQPPFRDWGGQIEFWKEIISLASSNRVWPTEMLDQVVTQSAAGRMPASGVVGGFLLAYLLALVPGNYLFLRRKGRLEMAWLTTPAIVLIFCVGAYAIGHTMRGSSLSLRQATIIDATAGSRYAGSLSCASIFSPARRSYDIKVGDPRALGGVDQESPDELVPDLRIGEASTIDQFRMSMWSSRTLTLSSGVDLGGTLDATLKSKGTTLTGTLRNNTGISLKDCEVFFGTEFQTIPDLAPGDTAEVTIDFRKPNPNRGFHLESHPDELKFQELMRYHCSERSEPLLVGWSEDRSGTLSIPRAQRHASTCIVFRLANAADPPIAVQRPAAPDTPAP